MLVKLEFSPNFSGWKSKNHETTIKKYTGFLSEWAILRGYLARFMSASTNICAICVTPKCTVTSIKNIFFSVSQNIIAVKKNSYFQWTRSRFTKIHTNLPIPFSLLSHTSYIAPTHKIRCATLPTLELFTESNSGMSTWDGDLILPENVGLGVVWVHPAGPRIPVTTRIITILS